MDQESEKISKKDIQIQSFTKLYTLLLLKSRESITEDLTGYRIMKKIESDLGTTTSPNYIYNFLKELREQDYLEEMVGKKPKSKKYKLTPEGMKFVEKILLRFDNLLEVAIKPKLTICAHCGAKLYSDYHEEMISGKEMNFCCIHCANAYKQHEHLL
ncbi:MAG: helix-turn-helix transcriptional regulator [Candidatus Hodarchaeales archaeon]|jgi:DNA-binding PadR family transcriptional regulator